MFTRIHMRSPAIDSYIASIKREAGVYDKGLFKAVFLAGGPASGKGFVRDRVPSGFGLKVVDSDKLFNVFLDQNGLSKNFNLHTPEQAEVRNKIREDANGTTDTRMEYWVQGRLGLILDMTGKNLEWIARLKGWLNGIGYETYMIFVNTKLDVAVERNRLRSTSPDNPDRTLSDEDVAKMWHQVQDNLGALQHMFNSGAGSAGDNFVVLDNSEKIQTDDHGHEILPDPWQAAIKSVTKFINAPVTAPCARKWIMDELKARQELPMRGGLRPTQRPRIPAGDPDRRGPDDAPLRTST